MPNIFVEEVLRAKLEPVSVLEATLDSEILLEGVIDRDASADYYTGDYVVEPKARKNVVLPTKMKVMSDDVTVLQVPYFETSNVHGNTVYIASEV